MQRMIAAYRNPDRTAGREQLAAVIEALREGVPAALVELRRLGRTLHQRAADVLAYFERPGTSNGPPRPPTAGSNTCGAPPSSFATSPTTSPDACSRPEASDPCYTVDCDEPGNFGAVAQWDPSLGEEERESPGSPLPLPLG